jgi:hypothetical protein
MRHGIVVGRMSSSFCTFRYVVSIKMTKLHIKKLDDCCTRVVFLGYELSTETWNFYDRVTSCTIMSKDTVFDEPMS